VAEVGGEQVSFGQQAGIAAQFVVQIAGGLVGREQAHIDQVPTVSSESGITAAGSYHRPPLPGGGRPQPGQVGGVAQVVQDDQPPPVVGFS
jgi:hypothetical protein